MLSNLIAVGRSTLYTFEIVLIIGPKYITLLVSVGWLVDGIFLSYKSFEHLIRNVAEQVFNSKSPTLSLS